MLANVYLINNQRAATQNAPLLLASTSFTLRSTGNHVCDVTIDREIPCDWVCMNFDLDDSCVATSICNINASTVRSICIHF